MNERAGWSWRAVLDWRRRGAKEATDFGDMGTAFGLDASLAAEAGAAAGPGDDRLKAGAPAPATDRLRRRSTF